MSAVEIDPETVGALSGAACVFDASVIVGAGFQADDILRAFAGAGGDNVNYPKQGIGTVQGNFSISRGNHWIFLKNMA